MATFRNRPAKPICEICHRPFDPFSPGATETMGPTCAKRAGRISLDDDGPQLALSRSELGQPHPSSGKSRPRALATSKPPSRAVRDLQAKYELAKIAFDDLLLEFHAQGIWHHNADADAKERELREYDFEEHSLADPQLDWLEPERALSLFLGRRGDSVQAHCRRVLDSHRSLLELDPLASASARKNIDIIVDFTSALKLHRLGEAQLQLALTSL